MPESSIDRLVAVYLSELNVHVAAYGTFLVILLGLYYVQRTLTQVIQDFRPILKLNDLDMDFFRQLGLIEYTEKGKKLLPDS